MNKMPIQKRSQTRQRELGLFSYRNALERGDFGKVAEILAQAEHDPELDRMLNDMQASIEVEVPPPETKRNSNVMTIHQRTTWLPLPMPSITRYFTLTVAITALVAIGMILYQLYPNVPPPTYTAGSQAQTPACAGQVSDAAGLIAAINMANDEAQCPGLDTIIVHASFAADQVEAASTDLGGKSAFPDITSDIIIVGNGKQAITGSKKARFFYVDANQNNGRLTLINLELSGGQAGNGGAIFVNGMPNAALGDTLLTLVNSSLHDNAGTAGGAIRIQAGGNTRARVLIISSILDKNLAQGGGAIVTDVRDNGFAELVLVNSRISNNAATNEGGAIYTNLTNGTVLVEAIKSEFLSNTASGGNNVQCFVNGIPFSFAIDSSNTSTDASCGNAQVIADPATAFSQNACFYVGLDALQTLIDAINNPDCANVGYVRLAADLQPMAAYNGGDSAFPAIQGTLIIDGESRDSDVNAPDYTISRDAGAAAFRFFTVDGSNGGNANLILQNITLTGGSDGTGSAAGAVLVNANTNGKATIGISNVTFNNNSAPGGNGGAVATLSYAGGITNAVITSSTFNGNSGAFGGAFYSGGFDGGNATALISKSTFTGNMAEVQGGAVYNNGLTNNGAGKAVMTIAGSSFTANSAPAGGAIYNNGRGGSAELTIDGATTAQGNTATIAGAGDAIYSEGTSGNAPVTGAKGNPTADANTCFDNTLVAAACP
jgi:hypothetical protein